MLPYPPGVSGGGGGGAAEMGKRKSMSPSPASASGRANTNAGNGSGSRSIRMGGSAVKGSKGSASPPASSHPLTGFLNAISNVSMGSRGSKGGSRGSRPSSRRAVSARTPSRKVAGGRGGGGGGDVAGDGGGGSTRSAGGARGRSGSDGKNKGSVRMGSGSGPRTGQGQPSVRHPAGQTTGGVRGGTSRSFRNTNVRNNPNNINNNNNNNNGSGWVSRQVSGALDGRASMLANSYSAAAQLAASVVASLTMQQQISPGASFAPRRSFLPPVSRARSRHPSMLPGGRRYFQNMLTLPPPPLLSLLSRTQVHFPRVLHSTNDQYILPYAHLSTHTLIYLRNLFLKHLLPFFSFCFLFYFYFSYVVSVKSVVDIFVRKTRQR